MERRAYLYLLDPHGEKRRGREDLPFGANFDRGFVWVML